jgi:FAD/FMN-containing dehydrogenase
VQALLQDLRAAVGDAHVLVDDDQRTGYEVDWTGRYRGAAVAVVRPGSTAEVQAVVRSCSTHGVALVPQGGNTGLVGGSVPRHPTGAPTIVTSLRRLARIGDIDEAALQVTVGAGATLAAVAARARASSLDLPVDFAARDSATIGGAIATNAGGSRVVRFGTMRHQVLGVEAVLASGDVVGSLAGLPKESAGLHWPSILSGSEGTLAIVTAARLRLVPHYAHTITALVTVPTVSDAGRVLAHLRAHVSSLDAVEVVLPEALDLVAEHLGSAPPIRPSTDGLALLIDCAAPVDPTAELTTALEASPKVVDCVVTADASQRRALLEFRDRITEAVAAESTRIGTPTFKLDVAVPVERLADLVVEASLAADADGCRLIAFGHLAEGNLHLNHLGARDTSQLARRVLGAAAEMGGTISAEHGIGVAKTEYLPMIRNEAELASSRAIKSALDPGDLLNPGVLGLGG